MNRDMLDITKKAIAYDKALKRAKEWVAGKYGHYDSDTPQEIAEFIFPELKENEGEMIRRAIIHFISHTPAIPKGIINKEQMLAWLEKQSEMNIQNNNPLKIEPDKFYFYIKDYFAGGCYRSKKGDIVLAKNGMIMMGLSPEQASEYFISINSFKENAVAWFEKQTDKPQGKLALEAIQEEMVDNTNKIDPKFKVGDWVVQENIGVYKVIEICKSWYEVIDSEDNHYSISFDKEYMCHLWTIQDAKDSDVLACNEETLLFKSYSVQGRISLYCWYNGHTNNFHSKEVVDILLTTRNKVCPATKEQRDILFAKMKEAGYEWDAEKKVLKNIKPKFNVGDWIVFNGLTLLVNEVVQGYYRTISIDGIRNSYDWGIDNAARLWTIKEARDGDVLVCESGWTCIFKALVNDETFGSYCFMDSTGWFCELGSECHTLKEEFVKAYNGKIQPATKEQRDLFFKKMQESGYEWNAEKKVLKNLKPKFKVGDWIVSTNGKVNQVISVDENGVGYTIDYGVHFSDTLCNSYHLWTIKDAKDGDVLCLGCVIAIFKSIIKNYIGNPKCVCYCSFCKEGGFEIPIENGEDNVYGCTNTTPATKEQRELLFRKMKEAGYEWDFDKKELKKIEDEPENYKQQVMSEMTNLVKDYIQQKPTWSEDDEKMFHTIIADLKGFKHDNTSCLTSHFDNCIAWLKSIKDRYTKRVEKQGG